MHPFELTILGCSSATPTSSRHPTAQILNQHERYFLIDCGEATQIQLRRFKIKIQRINHIFISHLHGDHYLGLPGLLGTMHLLGRDKELHIYSPLGLQEIIKVGHFHSKTFLKYNIVFHVIEENSKKVIFEDEKLTVETIPMNHRIPCYGFLFREKKNLRNIVREKIEEYNIPIQEIPHIKDGRDFIDSKGKCISNSELTREPYPPRIYAYCADTIFGESYLEQIKNVNLLYHESTFASDMIVRAKETFHCTATEAGTIASKANVKQLLIGHYSARYRNVDPLLEEAKRVFNNTVLAVEGETYKIT
jgi:ribonuclease Z